MSRGLRVVAQNALVFRVQRDGDVQVQIALACPVFGLGVPVESRERLAVQIDRVLIDDAPQAVGQVVLVQSIVAFDLVVVARAHFHQGRRPLVGIVDAASVGIVRTVVV